MRSLLPAEIEKPQPWHASAAEPDCPRNARLYDDGRNRPNGARSPVLRLVPVRPRQRVAQVEDGEHRPELRERPDDAREAQVMAGAGDQPGRYVLVRVVGREIDRGRGR